MNRTLTTTALLAAIGLAGLTACTTNIGAVKSTEGKTIAPTVGDTARTDAAKLAMAQGGPAVGKIDKRLEAVALFPGPAQPVGIAISKSSRMFMCFPRWADPVKYTVVELKNGQTTPFPDAETNMFDGTDLSKYPPQSHLVSVQAIKFDERDRLWLLDPGSFNFAPNILGAPKLVAYDINTGKKLKSISFPTDVALKRTYLNDVRFDLKRGKGGTAFITDSGVGGIIVVDLASGESWRHLDRHPSVLPAPGLKQMSEGQAFVMRKPTGEHDAPDLRADGIALSPDGKTLYYTVVANRDVFAIPTDQLVDRDPSHEGQVQASVKRIASKPSGNDGILCDAQGQIYTTDFEDNAVRKVDPKTGEATVVVQDARILWPDTLEMHENWLYFTSNQLARQPNFHDGKDLRQPPYALWRVRVEGQAKVASTK